MKRDTLTETEWRQKKRYTQLSSSEQGRHIVCETDQTDHRSSVMTWKHSPCSPLALSLSCNAQLCHICSIHHFPIFYPFNWFQFVSRDRQKDRSKYAHNTKHYWCGCQIQNSAQLIRIYKVVPFAGKPDVKKFDLTKKKIRKGEAAAAEANFLHLSRKLQNGRKKFKEVLKKVES